MEDKKQAEGTHPANEGLANETEEPKPVEGALQESEARFKAILDAIPDLIFIIDIDGRYLDYNPSTLIPPVVPPESFLGKTIVEVLPADIAQTAMEALQTSFQTREPQSFEYALMIDGAERLYESRMTAINDEQAAVIVRDITESKRRERLIQAELDLYSNLDQKYSLNEVLHECLQSAMVVSGMDCGGIYLVNSDGSLDLVVHCELSKAFVEAASHYEPATENARLVRAGRPIYVEYQKSGIDLDELRKEESLLSIGIVPILHSGKVIACLNTASHSCKETSREARRALESIAGRVGMVIIRARVEESLKKSEQNLIKAQVLTHIGHWNLDPATLQVTGSDEFFNIFGMIRDEVTLDVFAAVVHPDDRDLCLSRIRRGIEHGENWNIEHRLISGDGTEKIVHAIGEAIIDEAGETVQLICTIQDITERRRTEEERERLTHAIEQAAETVLITDPQGKIQYLNAAFERVTGYKRDEVIGKSSGFLRSHLHDNAFYQEMSRQLALGESWSGRIVNRKKDGDLFTEETSISPVRNANGQIVSYVAVAHDITREELLQGQLRQAQKMQAVGNLAGGVAHGFNNLLQVINGYSELALSRIEPDHPAHADLNEVMIAGGRAKALVNQLLTFSRRQVMNLADLDLNEVIVNLLQMVRRVIGEHITLDSIPAKDLGRIRADIGHIEQVLMNLCINARDAMPSGGTITIETESLQLNEEFCQAHSWAKTGQYVLMKVSDTGCGMSVDTLNRVLEPFFTTKDPSQGTGLGLSIVYGIVEQHGGMLRIYSEEDVGTVIRVYLPEIERITNAADEKPKDFLLGGSETILLAEDSDSVRQLAKSNLEKAGYTVLTAVDGREAIRLYDKVSERIDLALLDVVMPTLGGVAVFKHIRERRPDMPVLFASGFGIDVIQANFLLQEGLRILQKPYQRSTLLRTIREVLDEK